ncbi:hypothetical protein JCM33374_g6265 [Metschnikowia sp. JCM 33374]|nr:hypothetical protein JCM33374_g6265 [Metschnikowia sp. JCM 33374]
MVVDTTYYDLLSLPPTATALEIKKAYRKAAIKLHPDKNPDDPDAHTRFQEVGQAYQVLSDEKLREKYDRFGIQESIPSDGFEDPAEFFSQIFGGEAFKDWIGELSLMSELSKSAELSGENDEKHPEKPADNAADKPSGSGTATSAQDNQRHPNHPNDDPHQPFSTPQPQTDVPLPKDSSSSSDRTNTPFHTSEASDSSQGSVAEHGKKTPLLLDNGQSVGEGSTALTAEEEEKRKRQEELERFEEECRLKKIEMRNELAKKLVEKLYLYTESDMKDDVAESFRQKMKYEAESLKMESFGLEILHLMGSIYKTKAKILLKSQTFLGGLGGLWWSMKDKGGVVRDTFKTVASALDAQSTMQEYTKMQEDNQYHARKEAEAEAEAISEKKKAQEAQQDVDRLEEELQKVHLQQEQSKQSGETHNPAKDSAADAGEPADSKAQPEGQSAVSSKEKPEKVPEKHTQEDLQEMEKYLIGKVLAAAWSGSKFEISGTVRAVCDQILYDKEASLDTRIARAKGLKIIGSVFSETSRTELEAEEARVFEELVAEASQKRRRRKPETPQPEAPQPEATS